MNTPTRPVPPLAGPAWSGVETTPSAPLPCHGRCVRRIAGMWLIDPPDYMKALKKLREER